MKERETELTSQANSSNLGVGGDIFMPEPGNGEIPNNVPEKPTRVAPKDKIAAAKSAWSSINEEAIMRGEKVTRAERETQQMLIDMGVGPIAGGSGDEPEERKPDVATGGGAEKPPEPPTTESAGEMPEDSDAEKIEIERLSREAAARVQATQRALGEIIGGMRETLAFQGATNERIDTFLSSLDPSITGERDIAVQNKRARQEGRQIGVPNSLEDLAELIMKSSAPEWGRDGSRSLITEDEEGVGRVNVINFLDWSRNNMLRVHDANPLSPINFFSDIGTSVRNDMYGSQISFYEIVFTDSIWLDKTRENGREVTKENDDYKALRNQLLMETFLFSAVRNSDISYFANRGSAEQIQQALGEAYATNPLTRSNFVEFIFTMPSTHKKSIQDLDAKEGEELQVKREGNFYMGDATREALVAYMNIYDYDQLVKIFGKDSPLFTRDYEQWDSETGERARDKKTGDLLPKKSIDEDPMHPHKRLKWFNEDGTVKLGHINESTHKWEVSDDGKTGVPDPDYMEHLNIFLGPMPDQRGEIRTRIILSLMEKNKISYKEAQLAELWAYFMTHSNGVAAENDVEAVAFDWWTRLLRLKEKRKREKSPKRSSKYGNRYNMEGLKKIGLNFFEGARDIRHRSIKSIIQGGTGGNIDIQSMPFKDRLDYEKDANGKILFKRGDDLVTDIAAVDYEIYDEEIATGEERIGPATWKNKDNDNPIVVKGYLGKGVDGRDYVSIEGSTTGVPLDEIEFPKNESENTRRQVKSAVRFLDAEGNIVDVGEAKPVTKITEGYKLEFNSDVQKQFFVNHVQNGARVYTWIVDNVRLNLPKIVKGYDTHQNAILDHEALDKIKEGIMHDLRYDFSTWGEINFDEEDVRCEKIEVREDSKLVAKDKGKNGKKQFLDEEWYVLDKYGRRTDVRSEPKTYLESRVMTKLESMFGADAIAFIQYEIKERGLVYDDLSDKEKEKHMRNVKRVEGVDWKGNKIEVDVDLSLADTGEFRTAVQKGIFDYIVASEIASHRDRGSGYEWYDSTHIRDAVNALKGGELLMPSQVKEIRKVTKTRARNVYPNDIGFMFAQGGLEGFGKAFQIAFREIVS